MKEGDKNIEQIFRDKLGNFESPINDAMWSNISNGINATGATTSAVAGKTIISKIFSTVGIAVTTGLVATGVTVLVMSEKPEHGEEETAVIAEETIVAPTIGEEVVTEIVKEEKREVQIPTSNPTHEGDPQLKNNSEVEEKSSSDEPKRNFKSEPSAISSFMTSQKELERQRHEVSSEEMITEKEETSGNTVINEPVDKGEQETEPISASILASPVGGYAPLDVYFSNQTEGGNLSWNFGDGESSREDTPMHTYEEQGTYTVELIVTDEKTGKVSKEQREIEVLAKSSLTNIPNVFTPNGDRYNDIYIIEGENIKEFRLVIVDRYGKELFSSNSIEIGWNGKDKYDNDVPAGSYSYVVIAFGEDGKKYEHKGSIQLIR